jgi:branched-chain amino acid transport system substrate-binding protein
MPERLGRRDCLKAAAGIGVATTLTGCIGGSGSGGGDSGPIKFGNLNPLTGGVSTTGIPASRGAKLAGQHLNSGVLAEEGYVSDLSADGGVLGRDVEIINEDTEAAPDVGVNSARRLFEEENVHAITGCTSSAVGLAVSEFTSSVDTLLMTGGVQTPALTGSQCQRTTFRAGSSTVQLNRGAASGFGQVVEGEDPSVAMIRQDTTFGNAAAGAFIDSIQETFSDAEIVSNIAVDFGQGEYQNEIQETLSTNPDIFATPIYPGSLISFINQAREFNFFDEIPYVYSGTGSTANVTPALGDEMPEMYSVERYMFNYPDTDYNQKFVSDFESNWGNKPSGVPQLDYAANIAFAKAMERAGTTDTDAVISELEGMSYGAPEGTKQIRAEDHLNIDENIWFGKLGPVDWWEHYGLAELYTTPAADISPQPENCDFS